MSDPITTIDPDSLAERTTASNELFAVVFAPGGQLQKLAFDKLLAKLIAANLTKNTEAALQADLAHDADTVALVFNDPDPLKNGWWRKVGAAGADNWVQFDTLNKTARDGALAAVNEANALIAGAVNAVNVAGDAKIALAAAEADRAQTQREIAESFVNPAFNELLEAYLGFKPVPVLGGFLDSFDGNGQLQVRANWTVQPLFGGATTWNANLVTNNGKLGGVPASGLRNFGYYTAGSGDRWVSRVRTSPNVGFNCDHINVATQSDYLRADFAPSVVGSLTTGNYTVRRVVAGAAASTLTGGQIGGCRVEDFDNMRHHFEGSNLLVYKNGRRQGTAISTAGIGITLNGNYGFDNALAAESVEMFSVCNPATDGAIMLYQPAKVIDVRPDGSAVLFLSGVYRNGTMPRVRYTVLDIATNTPLANHNRAFALNTSTVSGEFEAQVILSAGDIAAVTGGEATGSIKTRVFRDGALTGSGLLSSFYDDGPAQRFGDTVAITGQSLAVEGSRQTLTAILNAAPAGSYIADGEYNASTKPTPLSRFLLPISANTNQAACAVANGRPIGYGSNGISNTTIATRGPGSENFNALVECIKHLSAQDSVTLMIDGQSDKNDPAAYRAGQIAHALAMRAIYPNHRIVFIPVAGQWQAWNASGGHQPIRIEQWKLCQDFPEMFLWGPHMADLQHRDSLHIKTEATTTELGNAEFNRRIGWFLKKLKGRVTHDRSGPSWAALQRVSATQVRGTLDLNGFDSIDLINSAANAEFHGGFMFATATSFATPIWPTAATVEAIVGEQQSVLWTFPANSFPGTVYARCCWGDNPFNPTNIAGVNIAVQTLASMIVGVKAGEPNVSVQPYFSGPTGIDYKSAS